MLINLRKKRSNLNSDELYEQLNGRQQYQLDLARDQNIAEDGLVLLSSGYFNVDQMVEIRMGLANGLPTSTVRRYAQVWRQGRSMNYMRHYYEQQQYALHRKERTVKTHVRNKS